jgi:hypothetical protein
VTQDQLQRLNVALDQLKQDAPVLMEWLDVETNELKFLVNKYRGEDGVHEYTNKLLLLERIRTHISYFLNIR